MANTPTNRGGYQKQGTGDNTGSWGAELNAGGLDALDEGVHGVETIAATNGTNTLTSTNYVSNQSRNRVLRFTTGTATAGFTVVLPAVEDWHLVDNTTAYDATVQPSGGTGAVVRAGTKMLWYTNGVASYVNDPTLDQLRAAAGNINLGGFKATNALAGTSATDLVTKAQMEAADAAVVAGAVDLAPYTKVDGSRPFTATVAGVAPAAADRSTYLVTSAWVGTELTSFLGQSGSVVQSTYVENTAATAITADIPNDDTIPQVTEGTQILSAAITPNTTSNKVRVRVHVPCGHDQADIVITVALFLNGGANAIAAVGATNPSNRQTVIPLEFQHVPAATTAQTYTVRIGGSTGSTLYLNGLGSAGGRRYGGVSRAAITLEEIKV
jgi:hypothetical protein